MTGFQWVAESAPLPGFVIRATVVLATGIALAWLMRKRSAQVRHRLWTAILLLLLLLPALTFRVPRWEIPLLPVATRPAAEEEPPGVTGTPAAEFAAPSPSGAAATGPQRSDIVLPAPESSDLREKAEIVSARDVVPGPATGPDPESAGARDVEFVHGSEPAREYASSLHARRDGEPVAASAPRQQLLLLWAVGCLGGLVSLAAGHLRFRTMIRRAHPIEDPRWIRDLGVVRSRLGVRQDVRVLVSEAAGTPMTGGLWKAVILLPASSATWEPERRTVVLMHEVVHIRRRDALRQLLSGVVLSLYWFHPLSWVASRLAAASREEACDERVLELGSRPSEYARHLMSLATGTTSARLHAAALSMARQSRSRLERRIMAILRPRRPRTSALVSGALLTVTGLLGLSTAIAHPVPSDRAAAAFSEARQPAPQVFDEEKPAAAVAVADRQPETQASGSTAVETAESPRPGAAAGPGLSASLPAELQEVRCYPSSEGREDPGDTIPGGPPAFNVRTVPIGIVRKGADRFAGTSIDEVRLCMRVHGDVDIGSGGLPSIAADGWILLESEGEKAHRLVMRPAGETGGVENWWYVGDEVRPFDELAREWRDGMLAVLRGLMEIDRIHHEKSALEDRISRSLATHDGGIVAGLRRQVAYHQSVVADLLAEISYHQEVLSGMRGEIAYHRDVVSGMRAEIVMHRDRVAAFREVKATYEAEITAIIPRLKTFSSERQTIEQRIEALEELIKGIEAQIEAYGLHGRVRKVEDRIRNYGLDARVRTIDDRITAYEGYAGLQKIEAEIEEETARLDEVTRRAEQAIMARAGRIRDTGQDTAVATGTVVEVARLDEIARLEKQLRDLEADAIRRWTEDAKEKLLELIRRL